MPESRGRGRYGGNRDRSRSRSRSRKATSRRTGKRNKDHPEQKKKKKTLADHVFHTGHAQDASDYVTISKFIIGYIQTNYEKSGDITKALEKGEHYNFKAEAPRLQASELDPEEDKARYDLENAEFMKLYEIKIKSHMAREETYQDNCVKAAGLLYTNNVQYL